MIKHQHTDIRIPISKSNPAICRDEALCILCGACKRVCENEMAVGRMYDLESTGGEPICIHCGQCANVCPVNSITEKYDYKEVKKAIAERDKIVIVSTSPSVRVGLGEEFGMKAGSFVEGQMISALRALGVDFVLDTNFSADLTIMEEAAELVERVTKSKVLPQFTSCCPAWIKFVETFYPHRRANLSSAKSPIGMQGPTIKTYFAKKKNIDPKKIINVALTPCTAKKFEIGRAEMNDCAEYLDDANLRDMDYVITTRELAKWLKEDNINFASLENSDYDNLLGAASGAGVIFGNTGGVMEAAARTAFYMITGENPPKEYLKLEPVRGTEGMRSATVEIGGVKLRLAVIHGEENAKMLLDDMGKEIFDYDFIEVMNCPGGCIGGGGQPKTEIPMNEEIRNARIKALYDKDESMTLRYSHENPDIVRVYKEFCGEPLSELAKELLHTEYIDRSSDLGVYGKIEKSIKEIKNNMSQTVYRCDICGFEAVGEAPEVCPLCKVSKEHFLVVNNNIKGDNDMANLKGTKTEQNLMEAFAGESQARNKYTYYASKAKKEGYQQIGAFFEETAGNEKEHAELWFKLLQGGEIGTTLDNLKDAADGEHGEWTDMYARMAKEAREEGFGDIADMFEGVGKIEKEHEERYLKLRQNIADGTVFAKREKTIWICRNCGHIHDGTNAPEKCPVCDHAQAYFEVRKINY